MGDHFQFKGWEPHGGQMEFLEAEAKIKVLACGRRWGKTDACAAGIVGSLLETTNDERRNDGRARKHIILAPTQDQANLLFDRVVELLEGDLRGGDVESGDVERGIKAIRIRRTPYPRLDFNGHRVIARSGSIGRSLRGNEATDIIVDEAAFLPENLITDIAMPMLATTNGTLTFISTPCGMNHFWRYFRMGQDGENGVWSRQAPSEESPFVSRDFLEVQKELISERAYRVEYGAEFLDSVGRVFRTEAIDACLVASNREGRRVKSEGLGEADTRCAMGDEKWAEAPFFIGIDWARYEDYTAVVVLSGNRKEARLVCAERFHGMAWPDLVEGVAAICTRYSDGIAHCDATGIGDAVEGMLRKRLPWLALKRKVFTSTFKGELAEGIAWMLENGRLKMRPHPELLRELQHFEAYPSSMEGRWKYGAPEGFHDDLVVALGLAVEILPSDETMGVQVGKPRSFDFAQDDRGDFGLGEVRFAK